MAYRSAEIVGTPETRVHGSLLAVRVRNDVGATLFCFSPSQCTLEVDEVVPEISTLPLRIYRNTRACTAVLRSGGSSLTNDLAEDRPRLQRARKPDNGHI